MSKKGTIVNTSSGTLTKRVSVTSKTGNVVSEDPRTRKTVRVGFIVDTTGSMDDEIEGVRRGISTFVTEGKKRNQTTEYFLISFGDISYPNGGDRILIEVPPTGDPNKIKEALKTITRNSGFGNWGETCLEAVQLAFTIQSNPGVTTILVLITDEPALQHGVTVAQISKELKKREYLMFVVSPDIEYYKRLATENGGIWKLITTETNLDEFLDIFNRIATHVVKAAESANLLGVSEHKRRNLLSPPED